MTCLGFFWRSDGRQSSPSGQVLLKNRFFWSPRFPRQPLLKGYMKQWHALIHTCFDMLYSTVPCQPPRSNGKMRACAVGFPASKIRTHHMHVPVTLGSCLSLFLPEHMHACACVCFLSNGTHFVRAGCPHLKEVS